MATFIKTTVGNADPLSSLPHNSSLYSESSFALSTPSPSISFLTEIAKKNKLDCTFISNCILAVGTIEESHLPLYRQLLEHHHILFWNLSGAPLPPVTMHSFDYQILNVAWTTAGLFTQAPTLACLFDIVISMNSWLLLNYGGDSLPVSSTIGGVENNRNNNSNSSNINSNSSLLNSRRKSTTTSNTDEFEPISSVKTPSKSNIAIIHCSNGRSKTGIVVAAFLKYINAFKTTFEAFKYFYCVRFGPMVPSLAPSYCRLFENTDRYLNYIAANRSGVQASNGVITGLGNNSGSSSNSNSSSSNSNSSSHNSSSSNSSIGDSSSIPPIIRGLKVVFFSISGLYLEEGPILELNDLSGQLYSSESPHFRSQCSWSSQFGTGFYRMETVLYGDFSIICRLRESSKTSANEKKTLLFKYQDNTSFLDRRIDLKQSNVDFNPDLLDKVKIENFRLSLELEEVDRNLECIGSNVERRTKQSLAAAASGKELFAKGIDEILQHHAVTYDRSKHKILASTYKFNSDNLALALALSGNDINAVGEVNKRIKIKMVNISSNKPTYIVSAPELGLVPLDPLSLLSISGASSIAVSAISQQINSPPRPSKPPNASNSRRTSSPSPTSKAFLGRDVSNFNIDKTNSTESSSSSSSNKSPLQTRQENQKIMVSNAIARNSPARSDSSTTSSRSHSAQRSSPIRVIIQGSLPAPLVVNKNVIDNGLIGIKNSGNTRIKSSCSVCKLNTNRSQLIMCVTCHSWYHTFCCNQRRIPFSFDDEKSSFDKYVKTHYGEYTCRSCSTGASSLQDNIPQVTTRPPAPPHQTSLNVVQRNNNNNNTDVIGSISAISTAGLHEKIQSLSAENSRLRKAIDSTSSSTRAEQETAILNSNNGKLENSSSSISPSAESTRTSPPSSGSADSTISASTAPSSSDTAGVLYAVIVESDGSSSSSSNSSIDKIDPVESKNVVLIRRNSTSLPVVDKAYLSEKYERFLRMSKILDLDKVSKLMVDGGVSLNAADALQVLREYKRSLSIGGNPNGVGASSSNISSFLNQKYNQTPQKSTGNNNNNNDNNNNNNNLAPKSPRDTTFPGLSKTLDINITAATEKSEEKKANAVKDGALSTSDSILRNNNDNNYSNNSLIGSSSSLETNRNESTSRDKNSDVSTLDKKSKADVSSEHITSILPVPSLQNLLNDKKSINDDENLAKPNEKESIDEKKKDIDKKPTINNNDESLKVDTDLPLVALRDHPIYARYFKMLKVGVPLPNAKAKCVEEGNDPSILDRSPDSLLASPADPLFASSSSSSLSTSPSLTSSPNITTENSNNNNNNNNKFEKKTLSLTLPIDEANTNSEESHATTQGGDDDSSKIPMIAAKDHPKLMKYFKMMKMGVPKPAVAVKMKSDSDLQGINVDYVIGLPPDSLVPETGDIDEEKEEEDVENPPDIPMIAAKDHESYGKYFKMLKVGLPKHIVLTKMKADSGLNQLNVEKIIELPPDSMIPVDDSAIVASPVKQAAGGGARGDSSKLHSNGGSKSGGESTNVDGNGLNSTKAVPKIKLRKKKIFWNVIDTTRVNLDNSLWKKNDDDDDSDIVLDQDEFNNLFVQELAPDVPSTPSSSAGDAQSEVRSKLDHVPGGVALPGVTGCTKAPEKGVKVCLIDKKRAQNGGIVLARFKISFVELRRRICNFDDRGMEEFLPTLKEFLPTIEEIEKLVAYKGSHTQVGKAEEYMLACMNVHGVDLSTLSRNTHNAPHYTKVIRDLSLRFDCMIYRQQFAARFKEVSGKIQGLDLACTEVLTSKRLTKILKLILKVGNQMNDSSNQVGFTLDSLLKLQSAKAFDNKTTILQYVIKQIFRNSPDLLPLEKDFPSIVDASRITFQNLQSEQVLLMRGYAEKMEIFMEFGRNHFNTEAPPAVTSPTSSRSPKSPLGSPPPKSIFGVDGMANFLAKANSDTKDLEVSIQNVSKKYHSVLEYFGEVQGMQSNEFFGTLHTFTQEFVATRSLVDQQLKFEEKKRVQALKEQKVSESSSTGASILDMKDAKATNNSVAGCGSAGGGASGQAKKPSRRASTFY